MITWNSKTDFSDCWQYVGVEPQQTLQKHNQIINPNLGETCRQASLQPLLHARTKLQLTGWTDTMRYDTGSICRLHFGALGANNYCADVVSSMVRSVKHHYHPLLAGGNGTMHPPAHFRASRISSRTTRTVSATLSAAEGNHATVSIEFPDQSGKIWLYWSL